MSNQTASFGSSDDWGKVLAIAGALVAFGKLPKKWGLPIAVLALVLALRD